MHFCMTSVGKCTGNCALSGFAGNLGFLPVQDPSQPEKSEVSQECHTHTHAFVLLRTILYACTISKASAVYYTSCISVSLDFAAALKVFWFKLTIKGLVYTKRMIQKQSLIVIQNCTKKNGKL